MKFIINVYTNWCGEDNSYAAIADNEEQLYGLCDELAYENFSSFDGFSAVLEDLYPDVEDEDYTSDMIDDAVSVETEYYGGSIKKYDPDEHGLFEDYEFVGDFSSFTKGFELYAGLGGSFGGAVLETTVLNVSQQEAEEMAYQLAIQAYEAFEGLYGLLSWQECFDQLYEENPEIEKERLEDMANNMYSEEIESWIEYYVKPIE